MLSLEKGQPMRRRFVFALVVSIGMAVVAYATAQRSQEQAALTYGDGTISLGMTVEEVEQRLSDSGRHIQFLPDKVTSLVRLNGTTGATEGRIIFTNSRVVYADYHVANVSTAEDLAEEIARAVETTNRATCVASLASSHGTE